MIIDQFNITGSDTSQSNLYSVYTLEHHSDIGIKYVSSDDDVKITYSDRIVNFVSGRWRMSLNQSPYTLLYANPSTSDNIPMSGWVDVNLEPFTGDIQEYTPDTTVDSTSATPTSADDVDTTQQSSSSVTLSGDTEYVGLYSNMLTETKCVYGRPTITTLSHNEILTGSRYAVLLTGYSFDHTTNAYLSSNTDLFPHTYVDSHQDEQYPPISAFETTFDIVSENELIINIPAVYKTGMIDIIVSNPAGYGKLNPTYVPVSTNWSEENLQPYIITVSL